MTTQELTPVLTDDEQFIENKLQQFTISKESLQEMAGKYTDLIKQGKDADLKVIYIARQTLKKKRTEITNFGKSLRSSALSFQRAVIAREDELIAEIEPTEKALENIEDGIIEEKRKAKEEADRKEKLRIQTMVNRLNSVEAGADITALMAMTDGQFEIHLSEATAEYQIVLDKRKQEKIDEAKRKQEELEEFQRKQSDLAKEKIRLDKIKAEQEETARKQKDAQDKIDAAREEFEKEKARTQKEHDDRVKALQEQDRKLEEQKLMAEQAKEQKKQRAAKEKVDKDEALKFGEDSDRFAGLHQQIDIGFMRSAVWGYMKSQKGKKVSYEVQSLLRQALELCKANMSHRKAVEIPEGFTND